MENPAAPPSFTIGLSDPGDEGSRFRLRNAPGEIQRPYILDSDNCELTVQGDLLNVVHGKWTPDDGSPEATLIVAEFRFLGGDHARRFRAATINFVFSQPSTKNRGCPEIVSIAPAGHFSMNVTKLTEEKRYNADVGAEVTVPVGGGGLNAGVGWELSRSLEKTDKGTLIGLTRVDGKFVGPSVKNSARWTLTENHSQGDGLPSLLRTAILLKRKNDQRFEAEINVKADVDVVYSIKQTLRNFTGRKVDPIIFDPSVGPLGKTPSEVDPQNLSGASTDKYCGLKSSTVITTTIETTNLLGQQ